MAKKRHPRRAPEVRAPAPPRAVVVAGVAPSPSWWFDFELDRHHLALLRVLFFGVLAIDAFFQIGHAPRYGAGEFNVPQIAWLPLPTPSRELMLGLDLALAYLCAMAALGVGTRVAVPIAAALDAYGYFSSQLDSYQHHYLVVMLLVCAAFVPWHDPSPRVKSWALRLFTVQVALLYAWAAVSKLDARWLDGTALDRQLRPAWIRDVVGANMGLLAKAVFFGEIALAVAWLWRRTWPYALALGLSFHVGVELAEFQIGQFSYVMIAVYSLMLTETAAVGPGRLLARVRLPGGLGLGAVALAFAIVATIVAWTVIPLPVSGWVVAGTIAVAIGAFALRRRPAVGVAHVVAWAMIATLARTTDQALDYHKYWGGSARRLGQTAEMRRAYLGLLAIEPDHGPANYYLGQLALADQHPDEALARFRRAQRGQPDAARGWVGEAQAQLALGHRDLAKAALDHAVQLEPGNEEAARVRVVVDGSP